MNNAKLLPYETIVRACDGEPEAVDMVLSHYSRYIKYVSFVGGKVHPDTEEAVKARLIESLFKYRLE